MSRILEIAAILLLLTAISCNDTGDTAKKTEYRSTTLVKVDETTEDSISRAEVKTIPDMVKAIDLWNYWTRTGKERKLINHASKVFRENSGPDGNPDFALISALCMSFPYITINQPDSARYYLDYCKNKISENYPIYGTYCNAEAEYAIRFDFDYPKGMAYLTKAYELTRKLPEAENSPAGSVIMSNISMLYYRRRDTAGLKYAQRACELAKKSTKDLYPLYISYIMLGQQEYLSGKYRQAIDHSIEALNIVTSHPEFRQGISDIYITMADSYSALGDNNAARIYYNNAFDNISTTTDESTASGISFVRVARRTAIGATMAVMPTIMRMLKMLLPTTLPIDNSALPSRAESTLTDNSGVEVPKATTVRPMTIDEIRKRLASDEAPSVRKSAPKRIRASPATSKSTFIIIF